ncbi:MAG: hypothetical protein RL120_10125, partial [Gammaproteobacteria bacterium]
RFPGLTLWVFKLLARLKFLRGTVFDPFGYLPERREERAILAEFEALLARLAQDLKADNYGIAVEIARLPERIRGYGVVKTEHLVAARTRQKILLQQFYGKAVPARNIEIAA